MPLKFVVGYDGSVPGRHALAFAVERAKSQAATVIVAHVLEWSPYSFLTAKELEERHMRRSEELERAENAILKPALESMGTDPGVVIETELRYGHIAETLCTICEEHNAAQIIVGRDGGSKLATRLFGSVASTLAQASPVPVTIVP